MFFRGRVIIVTRLQAISHFKKIKKNILRIMIVGLLKVIKNEGKFFIRHGGVNGQRKIGFTEW